MNRNKLARFGNENNVFFILKNGTGINDFIPFTEVKSFIGLTPRKLTVSRF